MSGAPGPFTGRTVVILRSQDRAAELQARLEALGAAVKSVPVTQQVPAWSELAVRQALGRSARHGWIAFSSANAVRFLAAALDQLGASRATWRHARIAAVGEATAAAAREAGWTPDLIAGGSGIALAATLATARQGDTEDTVLLPQSRIARPETQAALRDAGFSVDALTVYDTVPSPAAELQQLATSWRQSGLPDALVFASPSSLDALLGASGEAARELLSSSRVRLIAIGPTTAGALRQAGFTPAATATSPTADGLAAAVQAAFAT